MSQTGESDEFIDNIVQSLREKKPLYFAGAHVYDALGSRSLTAIIGPTASGKSTVSEAVIALDPEFSLVNTTTTRKRRYEGDPAGSDPIGFRTADEGVTYAELNDAVTNANLVNYDIFGKNIYATYQSGFPSDYNIGPITSGSVPQLYESGFKRFTAAFMVTDGETYEKRLREERVHFPDFRDRVIEGLTSIDFAQLNLDTNWLQFVETLPEPDGVTKAARRVIRMTRGDSVEMLITSRAQRYLDEMAEALRHVARDVH